MRPPVGATDHDRTRRIDREGALLSAGAQLRAMDDGTLRTFLEHWLGAERLERLAARWCPDHTETERR